MSWTLTTLNLNGLRSAVRRGFWDWHAGCGADVLCLQEVRMQASQMSDQQHAAPEGWHAIQADAEKKGYSGAAVWSRLPVRDSGIGCLHAPADGEGRVAWVDLFEGKDAVRVYSMYFPSGSAGEHRQAAKEAFLEYIAPWLRRHVEAGEAVAVCGDLNIAHTERDIHNPKGNAKNSGFLPHERAWMSGLLGEGWIDLYRRLNPEKQEYSWWSQRGQARSLDRGWRIDYVLATPALAERAEASWITGREPALSDHCPVSVRFTR